MKTSHQLSSKPFGRILVHVAGRICQLAHSFCPSSSCRRSVSPILKGAFASALLVTAHQSFAIMASPHPIELTQPDGGKITLRVHGDEHFNWHEDTNGFTVIRRNGKYVYAVREQNGTL